MGKPRRRSAYRPVPLAVKLEMNKKAMQGLANLSGKPLQEPGKRDARTEAELQRERDVLDWDGREQATEGKR